MLRAFSILFFYFYLFYCLVSSSSISLASLYPTAFLTLPPTRFRSIFYRTFLVSTLTIFNVFAIKVTILLATYLAPLAILYGNKAIFSRNF